MLMQRFLEALTIGACAGLTVIAFAAVGMFAVGVLGFIVNMIEGIFHGGKGDDC